MTETQKKPIEQKFGDQVQEANKEIIKSDCIIKSHYLIEHGFKVYLLSQGTNSPYAGSNGHLDATGDVKALTDMFLKYGASNIGISLENTNLVVLDIDRHSADKNGLQTLKQLGIKTNFDNEVIETTPRNGVHVIYRVPDGIDVSTFKRNLGAGLELVTDKITVAPSVKGGVAYKHFGKSFNEASMIPDWLVKLASNVATCGDKQKKRVPKYSIQQRWQMVLDGFTEGERNNQAVSLAGYLLRVDVDPNVALSIVQKVNGASAIPLPDREIEAIFNSAYKREVKRARKGGR